MQPLEVVLDVDTGTDDAGALLLAATCPAFQLTAAVATWGNTSRDQAARNTLAVLEAAGRTDVPVHLGIDRPSGASPVLGGAELVMGGDGLGDAGVSDPSNRPHPIGGPQALVDLAWLSPGSLVLVALAPLTTLAAALEIDPSLPGRLAQLIVMGGALKVGGNVSPAAEANIGHDPSAAAHVVEAFGAPGAMDSGRPPCLVPLDVTLRSALTLEELIALDGSPLPGARLLSRVWHAIWPSGRLETGRPDVWPAHDLLALWCALDPTVCEWRTVPLAVDTGGSAAWGATVADWRLERLQRWAGPAAGAGVLGSPQSRWAVATAVDADRYRAGVRAWLEGTGGR